MGLKDWDAALEAVDKAIDAHKLRYFRGRGSRDIKDWRKDAASVVIKETCDTFAELWTVKAIILEQLGRREEAAALRKRAAGPLREDGNSSYKRFHEKLKKLRLAQPAMGRPSQ
jgi:tetratricopeptide (TPR) repeat protein